MKSAVRSPGIEKACSFVRRRSEAWWHRLCSKPYRVNSPPISPKNTQRKVHPWAAEETEATEAAPRSAAVAAGDMEQTGAGARDARRREAPGKEAARTKRATGRRSTSAST